MSRRRAKPVIPAPQASAVAAQVPEPTPRPSGRRIDIEGLRAVAVGMVLLHHAGLPLIHGGFAGVDVFFVISGFLITGLLLREVEQTGTLDLGGFWARRIRRLLPAATLVLVSTVLASWLLLAPMDWPVIGRDTSWAAAELVNWHFAAESVDYLAEDRLASPVQHYWSLAVEEQFYVLWPLLVVTLAWAVRHRRASLRPALFLGLLAIAVPSFAYSVVHTRNAAASAYFVTTTRLWELAIGGLVAVLARRWHRMTPLVAVRVAWAGLALVALSAMLPKGTPWPGWAALVPTLGTAAVIAAGPQAGEQGPVRVLGHRAMVWIGGLSYSLYLWHWPIVAIAALRYGPLAWWQGTLLVLSSVVPAWLSQRLVEDPVRHGSWGRGRPALAWSVGLNLVAVGVVAGLLLQVAGANRLASEQAQTPAAPRGAASSVPTPGAGKPSERTPYGQIVPNPARAEQDVPSAYDRGCQAGQEDSSAIRCVFGDPDGEVTIALVGDSKALQWQPAFSQIGARRGWRVITYTKSACAWSDADQQIDGKNYPQCRRWQQAVTEALAAESRIDLLVTSTGAATASRDDRDPNRDDLVAGMVENLRTLKGDDVPVAALSDTQTPLENSYRCVAQHPDDYDTACTFPRTPATGSEALRAVVEQAEESGMRADYVDLEPWVCRSETCQPVVDGILVYRQGSHLTASYVKALAPVLERSLLDSVRRMGVELG